jgi:peptidoglycan/xylan/chitin deacetylase (PgdA/CDA1 family)
MHENPGDLDPAREREVIDLGLQALYKVAGIRPRGYRLPGSRFGAHVVELLLEYGFLYEGTHMATDFYPYYLRRGDKWSPTEPYVFGEVTELVGMPCDWNLSDFPHFEFIVGWSTNLHTPAQVREIWQAEFDYGYENCPGGVLVLALHPQVIGRGNRLKMLEDLIAYMKSKSGVTFERMGDYAERWKAANSLKEWKTANPALSGTMAIKTLT